MSRAAVIPSHEGAVGLFDSGLGGLTVLRELKRALPGESYVYLGDTARTPYGSKSQATVVRYARECSQFLINKEIKLLVVACNTASSLALDTLQAECSCPVIGTVEPAVRCALEASKSGRIGIIGTDATVRSGAYERALRDANSSVTVVSQPCPLFVPLVEQGMVSGEIVDKVVELYLAPLRDAGIDTLVLGCTHYPLLVGAITSFLGDGVKVVECSKAIAADVARILGAKSSSPGSQGGNPREQYFVTDDAHRFSHLANLFLGLTTVEAVKVEMLER